ncbi:uncharacterized protein JCM6883_000280 [Sporobolomyces salmoneus]|uniref:uncharacterized protein n=1 Tax=Sporobolomyces salmoneus TaxID=183962 RepID=UPI0031790BC0
MQASLLISILALSLGISANRRPLRLESESLCPATLATCRTETSFGCVDVQTNAQQCGACKEHGGIDCTSLEGVASAGCVEGKCEVWACSKGYDFLLETKSCIPAYP